MTASGKAVMTRPTFRLRGLGRAQRGAKVTVGTLIRKTAGQPNELVRKAAQGRAYGQAG